SSSSAACRPAATPSCACVASGRRSSSPGDMSTRRSRGRSCRPSTGATCPRRSRSARASTRTRRRTSSPASSTWPSSHWHPARPVSLALPEEAQPLTPPTEAALRDLGMPVPDSALAHRARELIDDVEPPFLVNHSVRAYAWAVELAWHDELRFDAEILYVSAMLHDIGLVPAYDLGGCFELDSAIAAEQFALDTG